MCCTQPHNFMGFVFCELCFILYLLCLCQLNEMYCSSLWKSHFTCFCGQLDINLSRSPLQTESQPDERQICILTPFLCRVVYLNGLCSTGKPLHICQCEVEGPLFPPGIRILQVSTGPVEAAGNGLRHQVACLYHCNRQVGPGEWTSVILMPLPSLLLQLDEQSDCLLPDPAVVFFVFFVCVHPCVGPHLCIDSSCMPR